MTKKEKKKDKEKDKAGSSKKQQTLPEPLETQRHYVLCGPDQNSHVSGCMGFMGGCMGEGAGDRGVVVLQQ
jgi:hypothetical protein